MFVSYRQYSLYTCMHCTSPRLHSISPYGTNGLKFLFYDLSRHGLTHVCGVHVKYDNVCT